METLNNFASIYCFIAFVIGAVFMLAILSIAAMGKVKEPRNKVHFYVARDKNGPLWLYMGKPIRDRIIFIPNIQPSKDCNIYKNKKKDRIFAQISLKIAVEFNVNLRYNL